MEEQKEKINENLGNIQSQDFTQGPPVVVLLKAGTAGGKSLKVIIPEDRKKDSVNSVVEYLLRLSEEDGISRKGQRVQEAVKGEMKDRYGFTLNGQSVKSTDNLANYLKEDKTGSGRPVLMGELIVSSRQEGATLEYLI